MKRPVIDTRNNPIYHLIVAIASFSLVAILNIVFEIDFNRGIAGVAFFLLFLALVTGPLTRIFNLTAYGSFPWSWRGELGIWFVILSIIHTLIVFRGRGWDFINLRITDIAALIALFFALILAVSSFSRVIGYIGIMNWKSIQRFAYVIFFLLSIHVIQHSFLRPGRPLDWLHWSYLFMILTVVALQIIELIKNIIQYRREINENE